MITFLGRLMSVVLAGGVTATLVAGPPIHYLTPSKYVASLGEKVFVHFDRGSAVAAQPVAWPAAQVEWLLIRGGGDQENRHQVPADGPDGAQVSVRIEHPGVTLIGADLSPTVFELPRQELREFVRQYAAGAPADLRLPEDRQCVRVRQIASAKTFVRVTDGSTVFGSSPIATGKSGQVVEIRPLFDPTNVQVGSDLPLRLYIDGDKAVGVRVQATHVSSGRTASFLSDAQGTGWFRVVATGVWRVEFHQVRAPTETNDEWTVYSGTLTFEVQKGAGQ